MEPSIPANVFVHRRSSNGRPTFEEAAEQIERRGGLDDRPRVLVSAEFPLISPATLAAALTEHRGITRSVCPVTDHPALLYLAFETLVDVSVPADSDPVVLAARVPLSAGEPFVLQVRAPRDPWRHAAMSQWYRGVLPLGKAERPIRLRPELGRLGMEAVPMKITARARGQELRVECRAVPGARQMRLLVCRPNAADPLTESPVDFKGWWYRDPELWRLHRAGTGEPITGRQQLPPLWERSDAFMIWDAGGPAGSTRWFPVPASEALEVRSVLDALRARLRRYA
jgi:hypothetical protein